MEGLIGLLIGTVVVGLVGGVLIWMVSRSGWGLHVNGFGAAFYAKLAGLVMALALLAGALPAAAQGGNPAVKDEGNNIYLVDGDKGPIPNLLPAEEVAKIHELVFSVPGGVHRILSPVSADDQTVLVAAPVPLFLSLNDGSTVPLKAIPGTLPLSNYFWQSDDMLGQYVVDPTTLTPYLITGDRRSGASQATPIDAAGGFPVFVSPDGRRTLYATQPAVDGSTMENFMNKVINNGVPAKLLKFEGAGHGLGNSPPQLVAPYEVYGAQEQLIWFRTYLMGQ